MNFSEEDDDLDEIDWSHISPIPKKAKLSLQRKKEDDVLDKFKLTKLVNMRRVTTHQREGETLDIIKGKSPASQRYSMPITQKDEHN